MHRLLEQQIQTHFNGDIPSGERLGKLLEEVSRSYESWEAAARSTVERPADERPADELSALARHTLEALVRMSSDAYSIVRYHKDGKIEREWQSESFKDMLGFTSEELPPDQWTKNIIHPDDIAAFARLETVFYNKRPASASMRALSRDGEYRWFRVSVHPDGTRSDGDDRYVIAFKNIHDMKSSILEKETSNAMMRAILNSTVDGVEVVERGGNLISFNTTLIQLWRLPSTWGNEPTLQRRLEPMARQTKNPEHFMTRIHEIMARRAGLEYDIIELNDERVFERYATPYAGSDDRQGIVWSYRDLTERRQAQSTLSLRLRYEKALSECATILFSHPAPPNALEEVLRRILQASRVSRVYIMENVSDESYGVCVNMTHEAIAEGVTAQIDNPMLRRFPFAQGFDRWADVLSQSGIIHGRIADFPPSEREILMMQDIVSLLVLPLHKEGEWFGFIGFDDVEHERVWSEEDIRLVRTLADMIGVHIEGQRRDIERKEYEFTTMPPPVPGDVSAAVWQEFGICIFRINHEGIFSHVEGEPQPFGTPLLGKHYTRVLEPYLAPVQRAWEQGDAVFTADMSEPLREVVLRRTTDPEGRPVLDGGTRVLFEDNAESMHRREIIGIVSHELRTPLSSILGALKLLNAGAAGDLSDEARSLMEIAHNNGERLLHLLNDIIDVEKIEARTLEFAIVPGDLQAAVSEAVALNSAYATQYGVDVYYVPLENPAIVALDRSRILQVMTNMISNAVKFAPAGTAVRIRLVEENGDYRVEVEDSGPGIPNDFQHKIFEKFTHLEPDSTLVRAGAGLGLSICKAIIDRHDGTIGFTTAEGSGTVFYFTLKALPQQPAESEAS